MLQENESTIRLKEVRTLSVKRNLSLLQSDAHWNPPHQINHMWTLIVISYSTPYEAHLKNQKVTFFKKEKNVLKSQKVFFQTSQKLLTELRTSTKGHLTFNSYSFSFHGGLCNRHTSYFCAELCAQESRSFYDFQKWLLVISLHFTPFLLKQPFVFWDVLGKE